MPKRLPPRIDFEPYGVIKDVRPLDVDENSWTDVQNVRFFNKAAQKMGGEDLATTTVDDPLHLLFSGNHQAVYWYYMHESGIRATDFIQEFDLDTAGNVSSSTNWDASLFNLIPVFNNEIDPPWVDDVAAVGDVAVTALNQVIPLPNFPPNTTCKAIRPYRDFLIALNITASGFEQPNRIIWSDASDSGNLPLSWDIADPTTLAGDNYLSQTRGEIIDGLALRDFFVIYKTHSMTIMRFTGGTFVMSFAKSQSNSGLLAKNCVVEFDGKHFIVSDGDIQIFDGQNIESIAEDIVRDEIFKNIDKSNYLNTFVVRHDILNEIWICYPEVGREYPSKAAIWNWIDNVWTFRDIGVAPHIGQGLTNFISSPTYDSQVGVTYDSQAGVNYILPSANPTGDSLLKATSFRITKIDDTFNVEGAAQPSRLEKVTMDFDSPSEIKLITKVIPRVSAIDGTNIYIRVGTQMNPDDTIIWHPEQLYTVGINREVDVLAKGRFISVRFRTQDIDATWRLHGFEVELKMSGRY